MIACLFMLRKKLDLYFADHSAMNGAEKAMWA